MRKSNRIYGDLVVLGISFFVVILLIIISIISGGITNLISEQPRGARFLITFAFCFPYTILVIICTYLSKNKIFSNIIEYFGLMLVAFGLIGAIIIMPIIIYIIINIFILCLIIILGEILIGKLIGKLLSERSGLVLGVVLIILGVTLFIGIPIIIFSSEKKKIFL